MNKRPQLSNNFIPNNRNAPTKNISEILTKTLSSYHLKEKVKEYSFFPNWEKIVGARIAKVSKPEKIVKKKILQIRVLDAVWAQELSLEKQILIEKLNDQIQGVILEDLKFVIGNPTDLKK